MENGYDFPDEDEDLHGYWDPSVDDPEWAMFQDDVRTHGMERLERYQQGADKAICDQPYCPHCDRELKPEWESEY